MEITKLDIREIDELREDLTADLNNYNALTEIQRRDYEDGDKAPNSTDYEVAIDDWRADEFNLINRKYNIIFMKKNNVGMVEVVRFKIQGETVIELELEVEGDVFDMLVQDASDSMIETLEADRVANIEEGDIDEQQ